MYQVIIRNLVQIDATVSYSKKGFATIVALRYLFIFRLKNPAAFNDEFWVKFVNFWVILFSWSVQLIFDIIVGVDSHHIYICNGTLPPSDRERTKLSTIMSFNNVLRILTIAIHIFVMIRVQVNLL